jgi:penicillin amidase
VQEPLQVVRETIVVKGAEPIHLDVRVSRHGPLVSDAINANNAALRRDVTPVEPLAFRWTALDADDTTLPSFLRLNEAKNWQQFTAALRDFVVPSQNFVYADVDGHIGYYAPGRIPVRARGDGSRPADGWPGDAEWTGWIPFDELPHAYDPPEHFIVTANNRPAPASYPHLLGLEWPEPYRAQRIIDLLHRKTKLTPDDFAAMQADTLSLHAQALLPLLLSHARPESAADAQALAIVRPWNDDARADSAATAIFEAWFLRLAPTIVGDDLGPIVIESYQSRFTYITRFLTATLAATDSPWCDDARTEKRETCDEAVSTALHEAVVQLTRQLGGDMARWRWDGVHRAVFPHQGLDAVALLRPLLSRSVPGAGDFSTIDVGPTATDHGFEQRSVPSYREIIDLSPQNDSRFLDAIGESGHPLSNHYDDFLQDWRAVRHRPMRMERGAIEQGALGHLRLQPPQH